MVDLEFTSVIIIICGLFSKLLINKSRSLFLLVRQSAFVYSILKLLFVAVFVVGLLILRQVEFT